MEYQTPLTLMQLARQRLLREEALMISTLEYLPTGLFPEIFEEALTDRRTTILTAMVASWPFPCLPAGALIKMPCLETLKALLDGLDMLIAEKLHPRNSACFATRRTKLTVLDLTHMRHDFWSIRIGTHEGFCSPQAMRQKQPLEICPKADVKKHFMVVTDLELMKATVNECDTYLLHWAQQQIKSIHLCCRRLHICNSPVFSASQIFKIVDLDCILQLQLSEWWFEFMAHLFPYLGQMRNLHTLVLQGIKKLFIVDASAEQEWISMLHSLFSKLPHLRNLHVISTHFLTGSLEEWLRYIKMPLETLSITDCRLLHSDLDYLSQCPNICKLRYLNLSGIVLSDLCPKLLGVLFERIKSTLQILELEECEMMDSHFNAILPALSQCFQLTQVNFYQNNISLYLLKNLLHQTAKLRKLTHEMYPAPLECYEESRILRHKFQELCPQLLNILRAQRQTKRVYFATRTCLDCFESCFYDLEARLCLCE